VSRGHGWPDRRAGTVWITYPLPGRHARVPFESESGRSAKRGAAGSRIRPRGAAALATAQAAFDASQPDVVVGTSLVVYPAAGLVFEARKDARRVVVNPEIPDKVAGAGFETVVKPATVGVPEVVAELLVGATG